jgi:hypothetical protein
MLEVTLRDIMDDKGVSIAGYTRHHINDRLMICYKVGDREKSGFDFYVVENCGWICPKPPDMADHYYDVLFDGNVYWVSKQAMRTISTAWLQRTCHLYLLSWGS